MDINTFYRQAREWRKDRGHVERELDIDRQKQLAAAWEGAEDEIRKLFPLEGARIFDTEPGQRSNPPFLTGNYQFDLALPGVAFTPVYDEERDRSGVIRIVLMNSAKNQFKVKCFYVWVSGSRLRFEHHLDAFLACCNEMGYDPDRIAQNTPSKEI